MRGTPGGHQTTHIFTPKQPTPTVIPRNEEPHPPTTNAIARLVTIRAVIPTHTVTPTAGCHSDRREESPRRASNHPHPRPEAPNHRCHSEGTRNLTLQIPTRSLASSPFVLS